MSHLHLQQPPPSTHHSHNPHDRINHSSPNKGPGTSSIGMAGSVNNGGMTMVGS
jgi:hypothetical protein